MSKLPHRTGPGRTYFVSSATWERRELFRVPRVAELLVQRILACREKGAYLLHEFVVMPDHFHLLIAPGETYSLEKAVQLIKGGFSHEFHDWTIRDDEDYAAKVRYIHLNAVEECLVERGEDWPFGSACGKYGLDAAPEKFKARASGAKAHQGEPLTAGLKPGPPKPYLSEPRRSEPRRFKPWPY